MAISPNRLPVKPNQGNNRTLVRRARSGRCSVRISNTGVIRIMVGKRSGRFALKDERTLILMAKNGASLSEIAAHFGTYAETIARKAKMLGVPIRRRSKE